MGVESSTEALEKELVQISDGSKCIVGNKTLLQFLIESDMSEHIRVFSQTTGQSSYEWFTAPRNLSTLHLAAKRGNLDTFRAVVDHFDDGFEEVVEVAAYL